MANYIELEISKDWLSDIGGKAPGARFKVEADKDGVILDHYWRKRLLDEKKYHVGAVSKVDLEFDLPMKADPQLEKPSVGDKAKKGAK